MNNLGLTSFNTLQLPNIDSKEQRLLKHKTDEFEAIILKMLLDKTIKNNDTFLPEDPGRKIYISMQNEQFSKELSGSFGYSELLFRYLSEKNSVKT